MKFKCAFKNLKKNYHLVILQSFKKWKKFNTNNQTTTFATIFGDMTKTKTLNVNREVLNFKSIDTKQKKYCVEPSIN